MIRMDFPHDSQGPRRRDGDDDIARDRTGRPLRDRYGRPVRQRSPLPPRKEEGAVGGARHARGGSRPSGSDATPAPPQYVRRPLPEPTEGPRGSGGPGGVDRGGADRGPREPLPQTPESLERERAARHEARLRAAEQEHIPSRREERLAQVGNGPRDRRRGRAGRDGAIGALGRGRRGDRRPLDKRGPALVSDPPRPPKSRRRPRIGFGKIAATILVLLLVLVIGGGVWVDNNLTRTDALEKWDGQPGNTNGTNWLLVGSDSRAGLSPEDAARLQAGELDESVGRTDTIMLVHKPSGGGETRIVSFPRDSWVNIPGHGEDKINQAFTLGGPKLLQKTIEQATGLRIDHYAEIGFGGFANLVDAVGGIDMCLDEPLQDPMAGIDLQQGCQKMDGPTALGYVRSRYTSANGDLDRVERQRKFLEALDKKMSSASTLANPFRAMSMISALSKNMTVNKKDHVWHLAMLAKGMAGGVKQETVPVGGFMDTFAGSAVQWDEGAAEQMFASMR